MNPTQIPLSLYIHFPWCVRKCPYCDFNSHALRGDIDEPAYISALLADLKQDLQQITNRPLVSIFMGGGTPSLFSGDSMKRLLTSIGEAIPFAPTIEITLEANPGTVEQQRFVDYRAAGINRLSIGIQSFQDKKLKALGRIHSADEAKKAIDTASTAGFDNFNLDLMHGLPEQTAQEALSDLNQAITLKPTHLSWYQLTLEPNTLFYYQPPTLPQESLLAEIETKGLQLLTAQGYERYEVSAYASADKHCQHNHNYWEFGDYLGIGAGAHSKLTLSNGQIQRAAKYKHPKDYLNLEKAFVASKHTIKSSELAFEYMLNKLRLFQPIHYAHFTQRTGLESTVLQPTLIQLAARQLIEMKPEYFVLTAKGRTFLNDVTAAFLA